MSEDANIVQMIVKNMMTNPTRASMLLIIFLLLSATFVVYGSPSPATRTRTRTRTSNTNTNINVNNYNIINNNNNNVKGLTFFFRNVFGTTASSTTTMPSHNANITPSKAKKIDYHNNNNEVDKEKSPFETFLSTIRESRKHLAAAAVARCISIVGMYPVDTIKTRIQLEHSDPFRLSGLYGGLGGSLIGQVPYGVLTFGSYEMYKRMLLEKFPNVKPALTYAIAAILGDLTGSGWLCPSEVVKQQMQAGMFDTTRQAVTSIFQTKGIGGFYQGYLGGVARDVPFRVAQLTSYEITKNLYLKAKKARRQKKQQQQHIYGHPNYSSNNKGKNADVDPDADLELSPWESALCGALAGTFSAAVTSPLDRIKTMLMTNGAAYGGSVIGCATKIIQDEGIAGLATGMIPRVVYIAPSVALFFVAYEATQQRFKHWS